MARPLRLEFARALYHEGTMARSPFAHPNGPKAGFRSPIAESGVMIWLIPVNGTRFLVRDEARILFPGAVLCCDRLQRQIRNTGQVLCRQSSEKFRSTLASFSSDLAISLSTLTRRVRREPSSC